MKRVAWILVGAVALVVTAYASLFLLAEAFTEVVVLRTYDSEGAAHETRVTVIDVAGEPWVRGRPYRGWFRRIEADARAELHRNGAWHPVLGQISRDPADAAAFERVMLERYGLVYRILDFMARMSANEVPIHLTPRSPQARSRSTGGTPAASDDVSW